MEGTKTYVFGQDGANSSANVLSAIAPLLQQKGVDPSVLAMMNNGGFGGGNNFIWAIFLLALFGWGGNGFGFGNNGGNGAGFLANQLNNTEGRDLLMQAIQGNHDSLNQLASTLQVNSTAVQTGFSNVMQSLCNIGNQVGMSGQQVINALQNGNMQIAQQIAQASAQSQLGICQQTNALQNFVYIANMAKADFYKSSLPTEETVAKFIKDYVDDADQQDGFIMNRFYADCVRGGTPIPWEEVI